jgi:phosphosulfolactate synthase (CoM biosynthesis protein A)
MADERNPIHEQAEERRTIVTAEFAFECIGLPLARTEKPRETGLNWFIDWGWDLPRTRGVLKSVGRHIDLVKMPALSLRLLERGFLKEKLALYARHGVKAFPGGMLTEAAHLLGRVDAFLDEAQSLGVSVIEVSESEEKLERDVKLGLIRKAAGRGFLVLAEHGPHHAEKPFEPGETTEMCRAYLEAGAWRVILEGEVLALMRPWDGGRGEADVRAIVDAVGVDRVFFELMGELDLVTWAIRTWGPDINIGNCGHDQAGIMRVEHMRRGIRGGPLWYGRV